MKPAAVDFRAILVLALATTSIADPLLNTGGQLGVSRTVSTYTMGEGSINTGVSLKGDYAYEGIYTTDANGVYGPQNLGLLSEDVFLGYGVTNWLDASIDLPFYQDVWKGHWNNSEGVGDLQMGLKIEHPGLYREAPFRVGYLLRASFPTGSSEAGFYPRHAFQTGSRTNTSDAFSAQGYALNPELLWTLDFSKFPSRTPVQVHANAGVNMTYYTIDNAARQYTSILGNLAVQYQTTPAMGIFWELSGESKLQNFITNVDIPKIWNQSVVRTTIGATLKSNSGLNASLGLDVGLTNDVHRTNWSRSADNGTTTNYSATTTPLVGLDLTIGFGAKGAHAVPFLGRFFAPEDTVRVFDTLKIVQNDTVRLIKNDTVFVVKNDTVHVVSEQNPKAKIEYGILVFRTINFETGSATLTKSSFRFLDDIAQSLSTYQEVCIEVRGYTDATGTPEANRRLSQARAQTVVDYLVHKGIAPDRLRAEGAGSLDPVADNKTNEGRFLNRRVEVRRIDIAPKGR
jgi:outer membrane protein OmpA-like peptidoglycan-associated protein